MIKRFFLSVNKTIQDVEKQSLEYRKANPAFDWKLLFLIVFFLFDVDYHRISWQFPWLFYAC